MLRSVCRLFGFRSVIPSQVHRSLLAADNALGVQSNAHPDGWGVAFYVDGAPHLTRSAATALGDQLFHRLSGVVASDTVLAHVRKATQGGVNVLNCHPFQHGRWVFAHNGDIPSFPTVRELLLQQIDPGLRRFILGDTDSEVVFYMLLSELLRAAPLKEARRADDVVEALRVTLRRVRELCSAHDPAANPPLLTCMVTNGETLVGCQGGKELFFSTYKTRCADRGSCRSLSAACEAPSPTGVVNHFIVSSEPLQGENVWLKLAPGEVVGVDGDMRVTRTQLERIDLPQWRPCA
jgi:predicted glutamine amidotransferase